MIFITLAIEGRSYFLFIDRIKTISVSQIIVGESWIILPRLFIILWVF